jgi:hypothetical protein
MRKFKNNLLLIKITKKWGTEIIYNFCINKISKHQKKQINIRFR